MENDWNAGMRAALQGDADAYRALLAEISHFLGGFLKRWEKDPEARKDLAQEILLSLHVSRASYDPNNDFKPWFFTIVHRRAVDHIRKQLRKREVSTPAEYFEQSTEQLQFRLILDELIRELSDRERALFQHLYVDGLSETEAAAELTISVANVRVIAHRMKKKFLAKVQG